MRIEINDTTEPGYFCVIVGDRFCDMLCRDEALGVVAALLFSGQGAPILRTYETWLHWQERYCSYRRPSNQLLLPDLSTQPRH